MRAVTTIEEIRTISDTGLREYILQKAQALLSEYAVSDLNDIGRFLILDCDERDLFVEADMEFTEEIILSGICYLHGVRILGDSYGEDIYLKLEVQT